MPLQYTKISWRAFPICFSFDENLPKPHKPNKLCCNQSFVLGKLLKFFFTLKNIISTHTDTHEFGGVGLDGPNFSGFEKNKNKISLRDFYNRFSANSQKKEKDSLKKNCFRIWSITKFG
jgi:hypothetical protein